MSETVRPRSFDGTPLHLPRGGGQSLLHTSPKRGGFNIINTIVILLPSPFGEGIGVGSALYFHTCYWRDIRAVISFISQSPILVPFIVAVCLKGILLTPPLAPPLQGRGTGYMASIESGELGVWSFIGAVWPLGMRLFYCFLCFLQCLHRVFH